MAKATRFATRPLRAVSFGVVTQKAGINTFRRQIGGEMDSMRVLGALESWLLLLLMIASNSLERTYVTELIWRIVLFVPTVIVAVLVVLSGRCFAAFIAADLADDLWPSALVALCGSSHRRGPV